MKDFIDKHANAIAALLLAWATVIILLSIGLQVHASRSHDGSDSSRVISKTNTTYACEDDEVMDMKLDPETREYVCTCTRPGGVGEPDLVRHCEKLKVEKTTIHETTAWK